MLYCMLHITLVWHRTQPIGIGPNICQLSMAIRWTLKIIQYLDQTFDFTIVMIFIFEHKLNGLYIGAVHLLRQNLGGEGGSAESDVRLISLLSKKMTKGGRGGSLIK